MFDKTVKVRKLEENGKREVLLLQATISENRVPLVSIYGIPYEKETPAGW